MKRFSLLAISTILATLMFGMFSCSDDDDPVVIDAIELTQAMLDGSTSTIALDITGNKFDVNFGHDGKGTPPDSTFRDVYTSMADASAAAQPGDVITKRVYGINTEGTRNERPTNIFVMVKQNAGYNSEENFGDWNWYVVPVAEDDNLNNSPNGVIDNVNKITVAAACAGCHSGTPNSDMRFNFPQ